MRTVACSAAALLIGSGAARAISSTAEPAASALTALKSISLKRQPSRHADSSGALRADDAVCLTSFSDLLELERLDQI
jgi:hypothetical protein